MILDMLEYYKMINEKNISVIYSGPIWADGIESICGTLRKRLEFDNLPLSSSQAVFSVFVEQLNNILMYSAEKEHFDTKEKQFDISKGVFVLGVKDKTYFIQSGNVMKANRFEAIKSRIDYLNTLEKPELRKYYKEQIKSENTNPESKGAGLGLIEIARRSSSKIEYTFAPFSDGLVFFSMFVAIGGSI